MSESLWPDGVEVALRGLGCDVAELPGVGGAGFQRTAQDIRGRAVALFVVVASSYGLDRHIGLEWVDAAGFAQYLTDRESACLQLGTDTATELGAVEALWVLSWALGLVPAIAWTERCSDDFVRLFPDPRAGGDVAAFCPMPRLRSNGALAFELGVAYGLHHCWVESRLLGGVAPVSVDEDVVRWRRHGLEWLASTTSWDDVKLDT